MPFAAGRPPPGPTRSCWASRWTGPTTRSRRGSATSRDITGPDIYESGEVTREIYTIRALVRSGNSGGPLVTPDGQVLGVIFAAAADDPNTGFAVTADEAARVAAAGQERTNETNTGDCA